MADLAVGSSQALESGRLWVQMMALQFTLNDWILYLTYLRLSSLTCKMGVRIILRYFKD